MFFLEKRLKMPLCVSSLWVNKFFFCPRKRNIHKYTLEKDRKSKSIKQQTMNRRDNPGTKKEFFIIKSEILNPEKTAVK